MTNFGALWRCMLVLGLIAARDVHAQSFTIDVSGKANGDVVAAERAYPMTVTNSNPAYVGMHSLAVSTNVLSGGAPLPQLCSTATPGSCSSVSACQNASGSFNANFTSVSGSAQASICLVAPTNINTFTINLTDSVDSTVTGDTPSLRTVPSYFNLSGVSILNRSELSCAPASSFTYIGEPMKVVFSLTARTDSGTQMADYDGGTFFNVTSAAQWTSYGGALNMGLRFVGAGYLLGLGTDSRISISSPVTPPAWSNGIGNFEAVVTLTRNSSAEAPYNNIAIGIAPQDADGVGLKVFNLDADNNAVNERASVGTTTLRYGRLKIANAYGSDVLPLPVDVFAQAWNGTAYVNATDDGCTPLDGGYFKLAGAGALPNPNTASPNNTTVVGTGSLQNGKGKIALTQPTSPLTTKSIVAIQTKPDSELTAPLSPPGLNSYLPGLGTGTFGLYKNGPVIYRRELY